MTRLPELQRQLIAAAHALDVADGLAVAPSPRRGSRRRRRLPTTRVLVLAVLTLLALAAIAVAATGLLRSGADVPPPSGRPPQATAAFGLPAGAISPLIQVPDPAGGLAWGLRTFHTTRGYACLQLGRVQQDKLGIVGRDGAFSDDGLFHPLPPQVIVRSTGTCAPLDGAGHGFLVLHNGSYPASGLAGSCVPTWEAALFAGSSAKHKPVACPPGDQRQLDYGLLGPHAVSVTWRDAAGTEHTVPAAPGTGAFLIVAPEERLPARPQRLERGAIDERYLIGRTPTAHTIVRVTYDDHVCRVRHVPGTDGGCTGVGLVPLHVPLPTHAEVATPLKATIDGGRGRRALHLVFRARVAATSSRAAYYVFLRPPPGAHCHFGGLGTAIDRDVAAGQRVFSKIVLPDGGCPGTYRVELSYRVAYTRPSFAVGLRYPGRAVAARTVTTR